MCDLNIRIGSKVLPVHKIVLASSCDYFGQMFEGSYKESKEDEITLNEIDPNAFELLLNYMYTSRLIITEYNVQVMFYSLNN